MNSREPARFRTLRAVDFMAVAAKFGATDLRESGSDGLICVYVASKATSARVHCIRALARGWWPDRRVLIAIRASEPPVARTVHAD